MTGAERYEVPPERLARWLDRWATQHGPVARTAVSPVAVLIEGARGATVTCRPPFPPLPADAVGEFEGLAYDALVAHASRPRIVGVLLVRLGAHAAGIFDGDRLLASKVERRLVKGRHRAGGSSARRFERRRAGQARESLRAAADVAARVLAPETARMEAVVCGGDRSALREVLADRRLAAVAELAVERVLDVPEPRLEVLRATPARFRATVVEPRAGGPTAG